MTNSDDEEHKPITHEERVKLAARLDKELDEFINSLEGRRYTEGWPEDRWEEEMAKHPFFMTKAPELGDELSPLYEGLQKLKYDPNENTKDELAVAYKDDGNFNFKYKKYNLAIIAYTEGLKFKCGNPEIESTLYNNRAAANFFLGNYRMSLNDCQSALKMKPDYPKALIRAANCCYKLSQYNQCISYCDQILLNEPENTEILELRKNAVLAQKNYERDIRKKEHSEKKKKREEETVIKEILKRGLKIEKNKDNCLVDIAMLEPTLPEIAHCKVFLDEDGKLNWPVMFLYPEYKTMDFIQQFNEDVQIITHIKEMFSTLPDWDEEKKYKPENLNAYFEYKNRLRKVNVQMTLGDVLKDDRYVIKAGTPSFLILVSDSLAEKRMLENM